MKKIVTALGALATLALSTSANAATFYSYALTGAYTANWFIPVGAPPFFLGPVSFGFADVQGTFPGTTTGYVSDIYFYDAANGGGLELVDHYAPGGDVSTLNITGLTLYTGTLANPTMKTGIFDLVDYATGAQNYHLVVTLFTETAVPEPASWAMLLVGFGALGGVLRARKYGVSYGQRARA